MPPIARGSTTTGRRLQRGSSRHDVKYATTTLVVGAATGVLAIGLVLRGVIVLHTDWPSLATFAREVLVYVLLFEAYFYLLHRLLHGRFLYRRIHAVHHRGGVPTVLTGLSFHPLEALLIVGFMPLAMWLIPIHLAGLAVVSAFLSGSILLAHSGSDRFPSWWEHVPGLNWYVTPRVHALHHTRGHCNYGATLSICDRVFGTLDSGAELYGRSSVRSAAH